MKKAIIILSLLLSLTARSQVDFEQYYSDKQLIALLQKARTSWDQLEAHGLLAAHYKGAYKDSLATIYLELMKSIADRSSDTKLKARSLWWDNYYEGDTIKARRYIDWAESHNLIEEEITGYIELTRHYIHINLTNAEKNILIAKKLLDNWKKDSVSKDSLKLRILVQLAHVQIHKRDGVKAVTYLLPLQDYANQDRNLPLKDIALNGLSDMYYEWPGQSKKATEWVVKLYEFYKKIKDPNKQLYSVYGLASQYMNIGDSANARIYIREAARLWDSIGAYGNSLEWFYSTQYAYKYISSQEYYSLIESNFSNRLILPPARKAIKKVSFFSQLEKFDSIKYYLEVYRKAVGDSAANEDLDYKYSMLGYYIRTKQYNLAIPHLKKMKEESEKRENSSESIGLIQELAASYAAINNYEEAYASLKKAYQLKDSLETLGGKEEVSIMEMQKHEELQTAAFEEEKKLQAAIQSRIRLKNKVRTYGLLAGLALALVIAGLLLRNNRQKQKSKLKIEEAYTDLKATQSQLIQSEKMASLGELTAGIAHEIQNPLNFVNNFSEVNSELIAEMKEELTKGNIDEARSIAASIDENEQKIIFHGKRADTIVKGMLQHSRSSSGQKELTDINELADEYLRLAYHGLRARDKSFNAVMKTNFDNTIGKINIVPQEIGRVILNLITNAFYAVNEKRSSYAKASANNNYEPAVTVSTKKYNGKVEVTVKDNGNGIPTKTIDKIFQPFFTTKPTGQGTGLGLSLSYDIVKAHGGELLVETMEGEGTEFSIVLSSRI